MLVLSRQKDEVIVIILPDGTTIDICVVDIRGDKVRVGVDAPKSIKVHRKEVWDAIRRENREKPESATGSKRPSTG
jgi:carbon storage regulator